MLLVFRSKRQIGKQMENIPEETLTAFEAYP